MSRIECRIKFPQNQRCRAKIALHTPPSRCRTFLWTPLSHFPLIRSRQGANGCLGGLVEGIAATVTPVALLCATKELVAKHFPCFSGLRGSTIAQLLHNYCVTSRDPFYSDSNIDPSKSVFNRLPAWKSVLHLKDAEEEKRTKYDRSFDRSIQCTKSAMLHAAAKLPSLHALCCRFS